MDAQLHTIYTAHVTVVKLRYDLALQANGYDHAVVFGGALHYQFSDDMPYPFKVNPQFKLWVPVVDNPNCFVIYTPGLKPKVLYWTPIDYWHKTATMPTDSWIEKFDVIPIAKADDAKQYMPKGRTAFLGEWDERFAGWGDFTANPEAVVHSLDFDRAKKTEYEIECIREANRIAVKGHAAAANAFRAGRSEYEIHFAYLMATMHTDEEIPYGNIIALNHNCSTLHYYYHDRAQIEEQLRYSFLIDAGASFHGYAADVTRTWSREKNEFQELIDAMNAVQLSLCDAVRPSVKYTDLHLLAHRKVADLLLQFGFARDISADALVEQKITGTFLPHGLGHLLGLQVHDPAGFAADRSGKKIAPPEGHPWLRLTRVVDPGWVFTIEPGFYFIESLLGDLQTSDNAKYLNWDRIDSFRKFGGIRIEDDVVVSETGHENLTRQAFADVS